MRAFQVPLQGGSETQPLSAFLGDDTYTQTLPHRCGEGCGDTSVCGGDFIHPQFLSESYSDGGEGLASGGSVGEGRICGGDEETPDLAGGVAASGYTRAAQ